MSTVGDRLLVISGLTSGTVAALLQAAGAGNTMGESLVAYSGLASATVHAHLGADPTPDDVIQPDHGGSWVDAPRRRKKPDQDFAELLAVGVLH